MEGCGWNFAGYLSETFASQNWVKPPENCLHMFGANSVFLTAANIRRSMDGKFQVGGEVLFRQPHKMELRFWHSNLRSTCRRMSIGTFLSCYPRLLPPTLTLPEKNVLNQLSK